MAEKDYSSRKGFYFDRQKGRFRIAISFVKDGKQIRKSKLLPKSATQEEAELLADSMRASLMLDGAIIDKTVRWELEVQRAYETPGSWLREMAIRVKQRAKQKRVACAITIDDLRRMCINTRGRCEVSGVAFSDTTTGKGKMRPFIPSIDRRNPVLGYTLENCRIVCAAINVAMFTWGEDTFKRLSVGYVINNFLAEYAELVRTAKQGAEAKFFPTLAAPTTKTSVSH